LFQLLDPKYVKVQFQVSAIGEGFDAAEYFTKYPGRFVSMHIQGWSAKTKSIVAVGKGTLDWKKIFSAAKSGGIQNYVGDGTAFDEGECAISAPAEGVRRLRCAGSSAVRQD
jgi:hypothetical protein